jgi:hypothetical protein
MKKNKIMSKRELIKKMIKALELLSPNYSIIGAELNVVNNNQKIKVMVDHDVKKCEATLFLNRFIDHLSDNICAKSLIPEDVDIQLRKLGANKKNINLCDTPGEVIYKGPIPIDTESIFPVVIPKDKNNMLNNNNITRFHLIEDLDIIFIDNNMNEYIINLISKAFSNIQVKAFDNLDRCLKTQSVLFGEVINEKEIYGVKGTGNVAIPSLIFSNFFRSKVIELLGNEFIFAFPTYNSLIFCQNSQDKLDRVKSIMKSIPTSTRLSNNIYLCRDLTYSIIVEVI